MSTSSNKQKQNVQAGRGRKDRQRRWWRIDQLNGCMSRVVCDKVVCDKVVCETWCVTKLCVCERDGVCVCVTELCVKDGV